MSVFDAEREVFVLVRGDSTRFRGRPGVTVATRSLLTQCVRPRRRRPRGRRSRGTCPSWRTPGPAAPCPPVEPGRRRPPRPAPSLHLRSDSIVITGTSGACRLSASATTARSTPSSTAPRSRSRWATTRSSNVVPLACPPAIQTTDANARRAASAACGLVALESSTKVTPSRTAIVSILCAPSCTPRSPSRTAVAGTPNARARAAAASALATLCGAAGVTSDDRGQLEGGVATLLDERPVDQQVVDDSQHRQSRGAQGEADGAGTLHHLRVLDHPLGGGVGDVVDAGDLHTLRRSWPWRRGSRTAPPCHSKWSGCRFSTTAECMRQRVRPVQLVAGQLDRQHVVRLGVEHRLHHRSADVADRRGPQPGGPQHRLQHLGRGRLAVGAGDAEPGHRPPRPAESPGELRLTPDADPGGCRRGEQRVARTPAGGDHEVDPVGPQRARARDPAGRPRRASAAARPCPRWPR